MLQRWRASPDASLKYQFHLMMILLFSLTTSFCLFLDKYKHASGDARYLGESIGCIAISAMPFPVSKSPTGIDVASPAP